MHESRRSQQRRKGIRGVPDPDGLHFDLDLRFGGRSKSFSSARSDYGCGLVDRERGTGIWSGALKQQKGGEMKT